MVKDQSKAANTSVQDRIRLFNLVVCYPFSRVNVAVLMNLFRCNLKTKIPLFKFYKNEVTGNYHFFFISIGIIFRLPAF